MTIEKWDEVIRLIRESGIPVYDYPETASKVLASMTEYGKILQRGTPEFTPFEVDKNQAEEIIGRHRGKDRFLPQGDVYKLLRCYGIPTARTVQVRTEEDLKSAAATMQYPVVLKVDAEEIIHKTDVGGVVLDIKDEKTLLTLFKEMAARFEREKPGFILQEYLAGGKEVILGVKGNEGLAPTIMFGLGGVLVEVMKDVQFRLAPLALEESRDMVRSIKGYPVLEGTRGQPAVDVEKLEEILTRLSQLASDFPEIDEMDLNPVLAFEKGKGAVVVDARLKL
jgi:acetyltransferase